MDKAKSNGKLWRLTKVLYFFFTIPIVFLIIFLIFEEQIIRRGGIWVHDYYSSIIFGTLVLLGYTIVTDGIKRILDYINHGTFEGFIVYKKLIWKNLIFLVISGWIGYGILGVMSENFRNECTGNNEGFNDYGACSCDIGYIREEGVCKITLEKSILNAIPYGSLLREYKEIPGTNGYYLGIYIKNYELLEKGNQEYTLNGEKVPLYTNCFGNVEGQGIRGDYYLFSFKDGKILNEREAPLGFRATYFQKNNLEKPKLVFSYYNTKYNNSQYFLKEDIEYNDENNFSIEKTSLINFKDYNGDGVKNEFFLVDHWDQVCGHNNYLIAGYDKNTLSVVIYGIKEKDGMISYWGDNFIPDSKGEVINGWNCGEHGAETLNKTYYKFNKESNIFEFIKNENRDCTEQDYKIF